MKYSALPNVKYFSCENCEISPFGRCEMKFAHIRVSEYFTFAEQIFHSEAISLARRANFVEKRPTLASWSFFCQEATKKIFLSYLNKVSNSYGVCVTSFPFPHRFATLLFFSFFFMLFLFLFICFDIFRKFTYTHTDKCKLGNKHQRQ